MPLPSKVSIQLQLEILMCVPVFRAEYIACIYYGGRGTAKIFYENLEKYLIVHLSLTTYALSKMLLEKKAR